MEVPLLSIFLRDLNSVSLDILCILTQLGEAALHAISDFLLSAELERLASAKTYSPSSQRRSSVKDFEIIAVVVEHIVSWLNVALIEELQGMIKVSSTFPQYLITAMLIGAVHVAYTGKDSMVRTSKQTNCRQNCTFSDKILARQEGRAVSRWVGRIMVGAGARSRHPFVGSCGPMFSGETLNVGGPRLRSATMYS